MIARPEPLEDADELGHLVVGRRRRGVQLEEAFAILGAGVLDRVEHRQGLLLVRHVGGGLAGRLLGAPDAQQVVVELERDAERPAERAGTGR